ncbi:MAG: T9SS type A sorting domain-containing protein, partial [Bacteroidetes bacterium]|nr:T9SS type A sorting domain-containing protein [Bacteroidota bacterium]
QRMDLSTLDKGFYLLVLKDDEGARMTRRVVKN